MAAPNQDQAPITSNKRLRRAATTSSVDSQSSTVAPISTPALPQFTFTTNVTPTNFQPSKSRANKSDDSPEPTFVSHQAPKRARARAATANAVTIDTNNNIPSTSQQQPQQPQTVEQLQAALDEQMANEEPQIYVNPARGEPGHIPRPPNAFILFRASVVHRKAVPASLENNHQTISRIIGACWRNLPARQRKRWEMLAEAAKAEHKRMYPNYRYQPVHKKKDKNAQKTKKQAKKDDEHCNTVAQYLIQGCSGEELERKVRELENTKQKPTSNIPPQPAQYTFVQGFPNAPSSHQQPEPISPEGVGSSTSSSMFDPPPFDPKFAVDPSLLSSDRPNPATLHRRHSSCPANDAFVNTNNVFRQAEFDTAPNSPQVTEKDDDAEYQPSNNSRRRAATGVKRGVSAATIIRKTKPYAKKTSPMGDQFETSYAASPIAGDFNLINENVTTKPAAVKVTRRRGDDFVPSVWTKQALADEAARQQAQAAAAAAQEDQDHSSSSYTVPQPHLSAHPHPHQHYQQTAPMHYQQHHHSHHGTPTIQPLSIPQVPQMSGYGNLSAVHTDGASTSGSSGASSPFIGQYAYPGNPPPEYSFGPFNGVLGGGTGAAPNGGVDCAPANSGFDQGFMGYSMGQEQQFASQPTLQVQTNFNAPQFTNPFEQPQSAVTSDFGFSQTSQFDMFSQQPPPSAASTSNGSWPQYQGSPIVDPLQPLPGTQQLQTSGSYYSDSASESIASPGVGDYMFDGYQIAQSAPATTHSVMSGTPGHLTPAAGMQEFYQSPTTEVAGQIAGFGLQDWSGTPQDASLNMNFSMGGIGDVPSAHVSPMVTALMPLAPCGSPMVPQQHLQYSAPPTAIPQQQPQDMGAATASGGGQWNGWANANPWGSSIAPGAASESVDPLAPASVEQGPLGF